jgi:hypothetical protein
MTSLMSRDLLISACTLTGTASCTARGNGVQHTTMLTGADIRRRWSPSFRFRSLYPPHLPVEGHTARVFQTLLRHLARGLGTPASGPGAARVSPTQDDPSPEYPLRPPQHLRERRPSIDRTPTWPPRLARRELRRRRMVTRLCASGFSPGFHNHFEVFIAPRRTSATAG